MPDSPQVEWVVPEAQVGPTQAPGVSKRRWVAATLVGVAVWIAIAVPLSLLNTDMARLPILGYLAGVAVAWKIAGARGLRGVLIAAGAVFAANALILGGLILIATLLGG